VQALERMERVIPSPNVYGNNGQTGVAAVSGSDAWAVGFYLKDLTYQTLVER